MPNDSPAEYRQILPVRGYHKSANLVQHRLGFARLQREIYQFSVAILVGFDKQDGAFRSRCQVRKDRGRNRQRENALIETVKVNFDFVRLLLFVSVLFLISVLVRFLFGVLGILR